MQFIKFIKSITKRIIALFTIFVILFVQVAGVLASEIPSVPSAPVAPSAPMAPNAPSPPLSPTPPAAPIPPVAPTAPTIPSGSLNNLPDSQNSGSSQGDQSGNNSKPKNSESSNEKTKRDRSINSDFAASDNSSSPAENQQSSSVSPKSLAVDNSTGGQNSDGNSGKTDLRTGNATNSVTGAVVANSNLSAVPTGLAGGASAVVNEGNGSGSANNGAFVSENNSNTIQDNKAVVINSVSQDTNTGGNSASKNVGNVNIKTGNANTTGTIITSVNTNVDGVVIAEFNVEDDHIGDIVLDFGNACIVNCSTLGGGNVANHQNGANSSNNALLDYALNTNKFQTNDAVVLNTLKLDSNTGKNYADKNTGGDVTITTGDANVSANALTFVNNNIAGNVIYGVVNIFGNLVGDIIAPFGFGLPCCLLSGNVQNTGNGAHSTNTADASVSSNDQLYQFNNANINNNLFFDANTGENEVSKNTDGNNTVNSGNANVTAQVINVANTNIVGGDWWLVLINQAGNWVGRILGSPEGANLAGSNGIEFLVDENGEIYASNNGNGANSFNNAFSSSIANNTIVQSNTANVTNNLNLSANTGKNQASKNTGGNTNIVTGDANIVANLVNFVNNNIVGSGRLFVTVVNVFGSWVGNFVSPDYVGSKPSSVNDSGRGGVAEKDKSSTLANPNTSGFQVYNEVTNMKEESNKKIFSNKAISKKASNSNKSVLAFSGSKDQSETGIVGDVDAFVESAEIRNEKKTININLAWLLTLIPIFTGLFIAKNKNAILAMFSRK